MDARVALDFVPPRWIRRLVIAPIVFVVALALTVLSPILHLLAAMLDLVFDRGRWRFTRMTGMCLAFCVAEVFGLFALFTVWVASGFGIWMRRPLWVRANNLLAGQYMELATNAMVFFIGYDFSVTFDSESRGPQLLFARHVGPGDVFRLMKILFRDMDRRCHAVGAAKLQWDPFLDIAGERLDFHYLLQRPADTAAELEKIRDLTSRMGDGETLILCPEGGNYTPARRAISIERERQRGRADLAEAAEALQHTLLPKPGGVMAAIDGAPAATVIFLAHAGLDDIHSVKALWDQMPLNRTVIAHGRTASLDSLPPDRDGRARWLLDHWQRLDEWIDDTLADPAFSRRV